MPDHQASIAASLRTIAWLLSFIVGLIMAFGVIQAFGPEVVPLGLGLIIVTYFGAAWRTARADVDREEKRKAQNMAEWAAYDRMVEREARIGR